MSERVGNVSRSRYEQLVAEARDLVEQVAKAQFGLGDKALESEPMRPVGGSVAKGNDDLFTVEESLHMFADDIGVALSTVEDWRWVASRWPAGRSSASRCLSGDRHARRTVRLRSPAWSAGGCRAARRPRCRAPRACWAWPCRPWC